MHFIPTLALLSLAGATPLAHRADSRFKPGTVWDIVLQGRDGSPYTLSDFKAAKGSVLDIDLFDNDSADKGTKGWIKDLAKNKTVVCYFSAGTFENWREDQLEFKSSDYGKELPDWPGEFWLDVKSTNVRKIMTERIKKAASAGCHAIDPDNIDGFSDDANGNPHQDGFKYDNSAYIDYVKFLSDTAKANGMVTGLKNGLEIANDVLSYVEFAVNEQCHERDPKDPDSTWDCPDYKSFTTAQKAVFNIEYHSDKSVYCKEPSGVNLSIVLKPMGLDTLGGQCS